MLVEAHKSAYYIHPGRTPTDGTLRQVFDCIPIPMEGTRLRPPRCINI